MYGALLDGYTEVIGGKNHDVEPLTSKLPVTSTIPADASKFTTAGGFTKSLAAICISPSLKIVFDVPAAPNIIEALFEASPNCTEFISDTDDVVVLPAIVTSCNVCAADAVSSIYEPL